MRAGLSHTTSDLESDIYDAMRMARLADDYLARGLEADKPGPLHLAETEVELLQFVVMRTRLYIEEVHEAFQRQAERQKRPEAAR